MPTYLNPKVVEKAALRIDKAKRALFKCRSAGNFAEFYSHWSDFLMHSGGALNAFDEAAKHTQQGKQWYGAEKRKGRHDELISYLHQARNAEEHPSDDTLKEGTQVVTVGDAGEDIYISHMKIAPELFADPHAYLGQRVSSATPGGTVTIRNTPAGPQLVPVYDQRYRKTFDTPTSHNGRKLTDLSPIKCAELYVTY